MIIGIALVAVFADDKSVQIPLITIFSITILISFGYIIYQLINRDHAKQNKSKTSIERVQDYVAKENKEELQKFGLKLILPPNFPAQLELWNLNAEYLQRGPFNHDKPTADEPSIEEPPFQKPDIPLQSIKPQATLSRLGLDESGFEIVIVDNGHLNKAEQDKNGQFNDESIGEDV